MGIIYPEFEDDNDGEVPWDTMINSTDILRDLTSTDETAWQTNTGLLSLVWIEIKWEKM